MLLFCFVKLLISFSFNKIACHVCQQGLRKTCFPLDITVTVTLKINRIISIHKASVAIMVVLRHFAETLIEHFHPTVARTVSQLTGRNLERGQTLMKLPS